MRVYPWLFAACSLVAACNSAGPLAPDVEAYQALAVEVQDGVDEHRSAATATNDCDSERAGYVAEVRPLLEEMQHRSGGMDDCMRAMGHSDGDNMGAICKTMRSELDTHAAIPCSESDPAVNRRETERHCTAMDEYLRAENERAASLQGMMGDMAMMSGNECHG